MGYAGGTLANPTYHNLGDHTETLQIDYDPQQISYEELLDIFWNSHNPTARRWSRQYMSAIFYHDQLQEVAAQKSKERLQNERGQKFNTEIISLTEFYLAEDYHQKYYLQNEEEIAFEIRDYYNDFSDFVNSTAAARLNGIIGGYLNQDLFDQEKDSYGLSPLGHELLKRYLK